MAQTDDLVGRDISANSFDHIEIVFQTPHISTVKSRLDGYGMLFYRLPLAYVRGSFYDVMRNSLAEVENPLRLLAVNSYQMHCVDEEGGDEIFLTPIIDGEWELILRTESL